MIRNGIIYEDRIYLKVIFRRMLSKDDNEKRCVNKYIFSMSKKYLLTKYRVLNVWLYDVNPGYIIKFRSRTILKKSKIDLPRYVKTFCFNKTVNFEILPLF